MAITIKNIPVLEGATAEDFAYEIIEECYDLPEFAKTYFDYKQFARDLFMCDYWFDDGFVFRAA